VIQSNHSVFFTSAMILHLDFLFLETLRVQKKGM